MKAGATLVTSVYTAEPASDRMGYRLEGPTLEHKDEKEISPTEMMRRSGRSYLRQVREVSVAVTQHEVMLHDERRDPHIVGRYRCPLTA